MSIESWSKFDPVIRGGGWFFAPHFAQVARRRRGSYEPGDRYFNLGFRLIRRVS
jgi:formylglycine-generating enzyme required for sulfatase activity